MPEKDKLIVNIAKPNRFNEPRNGYESPQRKCQFVPGPGRPRISSYQAQNGRSFQNEDFVFALPRPLTWMTARGISGDGPWPRHAWVQRSHCDSRPSLGKLRSGYSEGHWGSKLASRIAADLLECFGTPENIYDSADAAVARVNELLTTPGALEEDVAPKRQCMTMLCAPGW